MPEGWQVPSDNEWTILTDYLGGTLVAGGKMREEGHEHWNYYSDKITEETTNESGFTGLSAGYRDYNNGVFNDMGGNGYFRSSSEGNSSKAWYRILRYNLSDVYRATNLSKSGLVFVVWGISSVDYSVDLLSWGFQGWCLN